MGGGGVGGGGAFGAVRWIGAPSPAGRDAGPGAGGAGVGTVAATISSGRVASTVTGSTGVGAEVVGGMLTMSSGQASVSVAVSGSTGVTAEAGAGSGGRPMVDAVPPSIGRVVTDGGATTVGGMTADRWSAGGDGSAGRVRGGDGLPGRVRVGGGSAARVRGGPRPTGRGPSTAIAGTPSFSSGERAVSAPPCRLEPAGTWSWTSTVGGDTGAGVSTSTVSCTLGMKTARAGRTGGRTTVPLGPSDRTPWSSSRVTAGDCHVAS